MVLFIRPISNHKGGKNEAYRVACRRRSGGDRWLGAEYCPSDYTIGVFHGVPVAGDGGDTELNALKNRDRPPSTYTAMTVDQVLRLPAYFVHEAGKKPRRDWRDEDRRYIQRFESLGVEVDGHLVDAKREKPEACNGHSPTDRDLHLWLAKKPDQGRRSDNGAAIVAEISPRLLPAHASWQIGAFRALVRQKVLVRLSGWLLWDQEHPEQLPSLSGRRVPARGTLWEIHPVHRVEWLAGGVWRYL